MGQDCNSCGATHVGAHAPTLHVRSYAPPDNGRGHRRPSCCCNRFALTSPFATRPLQRFHRPLLSESFVNGYSSRSSVSRWCYSTTSRAGLQAPFSRICTRFSGNLLRIAHKRPLTGGQGRLRVSNSARLLGLSAAAALISGVDESVRQRAPAVSAGLELRMMYLPLYQIMALVPARRGSWPACSRAWS